MHATEREKAILDLVEQRGFIAFRDLENQIDASPATLRRDLERMANGGLLERVRGGAKAAPGRNGSAGSPAELTGVPFHENVHRHLKQKRAIGKAAAALCDAGTAIMIDGGSTTLQMCRHLEGLDLQVLTNSLYIVSALLPQAGTRILTPGGSVFREQNIILAPAGDDLMPRFHAPKLFMGAESIGRQGLMQADVVLVAAERRLIERADEIIVLVDSSKFQASSGNVVCGLADIGTVITDSGISGEDVAMLKSAGVRAMIADER